MAIGELTTVKSMALLRIVSSFIELLAALGILRAGTVSGALRINALLGLVGPIVLITVTMIGVAGLAGAVSPVKLVIILLGILLVFIGTR